MSIRIQPTVQLLLRRSYLSTPQIRKMSSQNQHGQGASHATDPNASKVPAGIQKVAPEGLERNLPESVSYQYSFEMRWVSILIYPD